MGCQGSQAMECGTCIIMIMISLKLPSNTIHNAYLHTKPNQLTLSTLPTISPINPLPHPPPSTIPQYTSFPMIILITFPSLELLQLMELLRILNRII